MKIKIAVVWLYLLYAASAIAFAQTTPSAPAKSPALAKAEAELLKTKKDLQVASANSASLTEKLNSVTQDYETLRKANVALEADKAALQQTINFQLTYSCPGPPRTTAQDYDKINIYVSIEGADLSELASRIRQHFRSIQDVQIVFSEKEADISVGVIGFQVKGQQSLPIGYALSIITTKPCSSKFMGTENPLTILSNHYLQTGPFLNNEELVSGIVSSIDTGDLEPMRAILSSWKKASGF